MSSAASNRRLADLVVVDGDPSRDIGVLGVEANVLGVMKGGEWVTRPAE